MEAKIIVAPSAPNYRVRRSSRAQRVLLKWVPNHELEVVVPVGFDLRQLPQLLEKHRDWIESTAARLKQQEQRLDAPEQPCLPDRLILRALEEVWRVAYRATTHSGITLVENAERCLSLGGSVDKEDTCRRALHYWLLERAHKRLLPWLKETSQKIGVPFAGSTVRSQKSRWASCSPHKRIYINYQLLFLPPHLVRHVFIHELCHTVHLNHSPQFWALAEEKDPDCKRCNAELRHAARYVPAWL